MGFYYNSGQDPQDEEGGWRETLAIIFVVFRILAKPMGFLLGAIIGLVFIVWLFSITPLLGLGAIAALVLALILRGVWEARHPPELQ